jgi:Holliday junction DNA helicase RuvA
MICGLSYSSFLKEDGANFGEFTAGEVTYLVKIPEKAVFPDKGNLFVYHHITEQGQSLYGFLSREDRDLFKDLISVDGVGPTMALKILSSYESDKIRIDIADGDRADLCKAKGVGAKSADKIVNELKAKYAKYATVKLPHKEIEITNKFNNDLKIVAESSIKALVKLGWSNKEAKDKVLLVAKNYSAQQEVVGGMGLPPMDELASKFVQLALTT